MTLGSDTVAKPDEPAAGTARTPLAQLLAMAVLGAAVLAFAAGQMDLWGRNVFWIDEYYSIWASDPSTSFAKLLTERILPDSNPPLYFTLLAIERMAIAEPRTAFLVFNIIAVLVTLAFVLRIARRTEMVGVALVATAMFLVSGAAMYYAAEGRVYFAGMCCSLAIAFAAAATVERGPGPRPIMTFAALGVLAAFTHVFSALFAGAIAAGLVVEALVSRRADVARAGLALGVSASVVIGVWFVLARESMENVTWIEFTIQSVMEAIWFVRSLTVGSNLVGLLLFTFLAWTALQRSFRPQLRLFAIGGALFVALPLLASFITPMIAGRYWIIGAPALLVLAAFAVRAQILARDSAGSRSAGFIPMGAAAAGAAAVLIASAIGFVDAQQSIGRKPDWVGVDLARSLSAGCPASSVHIHGRPALYATAGNIPEDIFIRTDRQEVPYIQPETAACPLLAWAEHVVRGADFLTVAGDAELLELVKVAAGETPSLQPRVVRHASGFVVVRGDAAEGLVR